MDMLHEEVSSGIRWHILILRHTAAELELEIGIFRSLMLPHSQVKVMDFYTRARVGILEVL